jgi:DnaJ domain/Pentapeptide repeats (8 copies)
MANPDHIRQLCEGARPWNAWREANPDIAPDLSGAELALGQRQFGPSTGGPINLRGANLERAMLRHATLVGADLEGASLHAADLAYARLNGARLTGADLTGALLDHADFAGVCCEGAIIAGTNLDAVANLQQSQIDAMNGDRYTVVPGDRKIPLRWRVGPQATLLDPETKVATQPAAEPDGTMAPETPAAGETMAPMDAAAWPGAEPEAEAVEEPQVEVKPRPAKPSMADHFALLDLEPTATADEIRKAYRKLAKVYHPDLNPGDAAAAQRFKEIDEAYRILLAPPPASMPPPPFYRSWTAVGAIFVTMMAGPPAVLYWFVQPSMRLAEPSRIAVSDTRDNPAPYPGPSKPEPGQPTMPTAEPEPSAPLPPAASPTPEEQVAAVAPPPEPAPAEPPMVLEDKPAEPPAQAEPMPPAASPPPEEQVAAVTPSPEPAPAEPPMVLEDKPAEPPARAEDEPAPPPVAPVQAQPEPAAIAVDVPDIAAPASPPPPPPAEAGPSAESRAADLEPAKPAAPDKAAATIQMARTDPATEAEPEAAPSPPQTATDPAPPPEESADQTASIDPLTLQLPERRPNDIARSQLQSTFANLRLEEDKRLWAAAAKGHGRDALEVYLRAFPKGTYASLARQRLAALKAAQPSPTAPLQDRKDRKHAAETPAKPLEAGPGDLAPAEPRAAAAPTPASEPHEQSPRVRWPSSDEPFADRLPGVR